MQTANNSNIDLTGTGAAYVRVSTDQQDTDRQYNSIHAFESRCGVTIAKQHWFEDEGWARDADKRRPAFNKLLGLASGGQVRWIVVDRLDRFGTKNAKRLMGYLADLEDAGCRLFDANGKEWTGDDAATEITAWLSGRTSTAEQHEKSSRVMGGKIALARAGEWQGGPTRLGLDVACYSRETGKELWRVVFEGRHKRLKVYTDGRTEQFDGEGNFPQSQRVTEVLRIAPSRDKAKIEAAVSVFKRFATESISFTALGHYLNKLGFTHCMGGAFHGQHIEKMLGDPVYLGYYTWNKHHSGKFHRYKGGQAVPELNYEEKLTVNDREDWVQSHRLFQPLVDAKTWAAVQKKLHKPKRDRSPVAPARYLSGLLFCGNCGERMVGGPSRKRLKTRGGHEGHLEYMCGSYHKDVRDGALREGKRKSTCLRNGVFQDDFEQYIEKYLEETGKRLELMTTGSEAGNPTDRLEANQEAVWQAYCDGLDRLVRYLAKHHPDEYAALLKEDAARRKTDVQSLKANESSPGLPPGTLVKKYGKKFVEGCRKGDAPLTPSGFVADLLHAYHANFDASGLAAEIKQLDEEHTRLTHRYADLPTTRAKEKAAAELAALEARIEELEKQQEDVSGLVLVQYRELQSLSVAITEAKLAMKASIGERALRHRAEVLRGVIQRIECTFTATGKTKGGPGNSNARLVSVTIYPVCGEASTFAAAPTRENVLRPTPVWTLW